MKERIIIEDFEHMEGKNCQLSSVRKILNYYGINLTEEMIMGIASGIGFIYWDMKQMSYPFVGGLNGKNINLFETSLRNLGGSAELVMQTTSRKTSFTQVKEILKDEKPFIPFVDMAFLPYFFRDDAPYPNESAGHFGGHTFVVYGIDENENTIYVSDRFLQPNTLTIDQFMDAHSSTYPPFASKNKKVVINPPMKSFDLKDSIKKAIRENAEVMMEPPITNLGLKGILKFEKMIGTTWMQFPPEKMILTLYMTYIYNATGGTGGALGRNMYTSFLEEAQEFIQDDNLFKATDLYKQAAETWDKVALFLLPDELPALKATRSTIDESNRVQEDSKVHYQKKLREIDEKWLSVKEDAIKEASNFEPFILRLQKNIRLAYELESEAWNYLKKI
ncbi:MAG: DUF4872 domain-containing protein [Asgard group archaeon]|nr:DUF4872 domain-containing protein [Asgard group archaeon]